MIRLTNKGEAVTGALAADQAEFSSYLLGTQSQVELDRMARILDKLLDHLRPRSYDDLRTSALDRWRAHNRDLP